jgi:hypothetical protein
MAVSLAPVSIELHDGSTLDVFVLAGGAMTFRVVRPDRRETVGDLTEAQSDRLWAEVAAKRAAAA